MGKNKGMGRKVEAREPLLILQVQVLGLVVVKRAFVVKAKLLFGQLASNWKAGKYNLKDLLLLSHPSQKGFVKIPNSNKCWLGWRTLAYCWWECKLV